ncbi:hypothetical protein, partial [Oxalobacter formigenes]
MTANRMRESALQIYEHPYTTSNTAAIIRSRLLDMKRFVKTFLTTNFVNASKTRKLFAERYALQNDAINILYQRYLGPKKDIDALQSAMDELIVAQDRALALVRGGAAPPPPPPRPQATP